MENKIINLKVKIMSEESLDNENLDKLTRNLLSEIKDIDIEEVTIKSGSNIPSGAKGEPITFGVLMVAVLPTVLPSLILLLQNWMLRQQSQKIKVKIGENEIEVPQTMSSRKVQEYIALLSSIED